MKSYNIGQNQMKLEIKDTREKNANGFFLVPFVGDSMNLKCRVKLTG